MNLQNMAAINRAAPGAFYERPAADPMQCICYNHASYRKGFAVWALDNIHVWRAFEREALKVWNRGRRHYSARTIIEVLRHESALSDTGSEWKLNDHQTPDLARLFLDLHPNCAGLFETRSR